MAGRRVSCVVCETVRRAERTPFSHETNGPDSDVFAGLGVALHIRNISRVPIRVMQAPSCAGEIRCARWRPTLACAPHAAQTKASNRGDATRVERCTRFAVSRALDMRARFIGRRRQTDRARPAVYRCRVDPAMRVPVAVVKHSATRCSHATVAERSGPGGGPAGLNIAVVGGPGCSTQRGTAHDVIDPVRRDAGSTTIRAASTVRTRWRARPATPPRVDRV